MLPFLASLTAEFCLVRVFFSSGFIVQQFTFSSFLLLLFSLFFAVHFQLPSHPTGKAGGFSNIQLLHVLILVVTIRRSMWSQNSISYLKPINTGIYVIKSSETSSEWCLTNP